MNKVRRDLPRQLDHLHRTGAVLFGLGLGIFGVLGFVNRLDMFSTTGRPVLGLSSNGLLSTISVVVAAILIAAARERADAERAVARHTASPEVVARIHALRDVRRPEERVQRWRVSHA